MAYRTEGRRLPQAVLKLRAGAIMTLAKYSAEQLSDKGRGRETYGSKRRDCPYLGSQRRRQESATCSYFQMSSYTTILSLFYPYLYGDLSFGVHLVVGIVCHCCLLLQYQVLFRAMLINKDSLRFQECFELLSDRM